MTDIETIIKELNSIATSISAAVEEQNAATQEISRSVSAASSGVQEVNNLIVNVASMSNATEEKSKSLLQTSELVEIHVEKLNEATIKFVKIARAS
jgi:methyl-accepting chemotaxis protein